LLIQLFIGLVIVAVTTVMAALFVGAIPVTLNYFSGWLRRRPHNRKAIIAMAAATMWLILSMTAGVWLWAMVFLAIGAFDQLEVSVYFSVVSFTTLGFGDVLLPVRWRLLAGICAANGLIVFGLNTAFLVEFFNRIRQIQKE